MARRGVVKPRRIDADPIYGNVLVTKLINRSMRDGKKTVAQKEVYEALELIKERTKEDPVKLFVQAIENIKPSMEVRSRRVGGAAYQVPQPVRGPRKESLAIRWLIEIANKNDDEQTWLSGKVFFHEGEFDGVSNEATTLTIEEDATIQIIVNI